MAKTTRNLWIFLLATFAWTWAFYAPLALGRHNPYQMPWMILLILGGMGPSVVGVVMAVWTLDRDGRRDFFRRCFSVRRIRWFGWAVILLLFPALLGLAVLLDGLLGGAAPGLEQFRALMANPVMWPMAAFISFLSGPWAEEFGWRGYALERISQRFGKITGAVLLGVIWAVWHLPLYGMPGTWHAEMGFRLAGFWTFILLNIGLSLVMAGVFWTNQRSILSGMLLHFTSNFTSQLAAPISDRTEILYVLLLLAAGSLAAAAVLRAERGAPVLEPRAAAG